MENNFCCAVIGQHPIGFDKEGEGYNALKLALVQKIMELRQQSVTRVAAVADCDIGLYAGEIINALRRLQDNLMLYVVTPHDDFYSKRQNSALRPDCHGK